MPYQPIPVRRAAKLYAELGNWRLVALAMTRENGRPWQTHSILRAVWLADRRGAIPPLGDELLAALRREHA